MTIVADKGFFPATKLISKSGKALEKRLTFTKIKKNPNQPTLLANPGSDDGKRSIFKSSLTIITCVNYLVHINKCVCYFDFESVFNNLFRLYFFYNLLIAINKIVNDYCRRESRISKFIQSRQVIFDDCFAQVI